MAKYGRRLNGTCPICHQWFEAILLGHLRVGHGVPVRDCEEEYAEANGTDPAYGSGTTHFTCACGLVLTVTDMYEHIQDCIVVILMQGELQCDS